MSQFYAHTLPGFEPIAWLEMRKRLRKAVHRGDAFAEEKNGIVFFDTDSPPADVLTLRTTEDVFLLAAEHDTLSRDYRDLRGIAQLLGESAAFEAAMQQWLRISGLNWPVSARVVARKTGEHAYRRMDVEDSARKALQQRHGRRLNWVPDGGDLEIWVNVLGSRLVIGLRLSDRGMRHRDYKTAHISASLRPSAAAALVLLADAPEHGVALDPTCGAGTILAEFGAHNRAVTVLGGDLNRSAAYAARANTSAPILIWRAERLPLANASIDAIACNPPFGKKLGSKREIIDLYPKLLRESARILKPGGRAVFITSAFDLFRDAIRTAPEFQIDRGYSVALLGEWGRIYLLRKNPESRIQNPDR